MPLYRDYLPTLRFGDALAVAPDGRTVSYAGDALGQFNVAVQPLAGGEPRHLTDLADLAVQEIAWYPDGKSLLFAADRGGDENTQLHRVGIDGGAPAALTDAAHARHSLPSLAPFSPDGSLLAYTANDRAPGDEDVLIRDAGGDGVRRAYTGGGRLVIGGWSPDGTRVSLAEWRDSATDHVLHLAFADGRPPVRLTPDGATPPATYWLGPWLPDGSGFLVRSNAGREFTGLAAVDATSGELTWIDAGERDVEAVALSADGHTLVWVVNADGASHLRVRDLASGINLAAPEIPAGVASSLAVTPDGRTAAMMLSTWSRPRNLAVVDLAEGALRWLTDARPVAADPVSFVGPTLVRYPSTDGYRIPAQLYRPRTDGRRAGVLLSVHGGPSYQERPIYSLYGGLYQYLLSRGIAVLAPNIRGSTGYGVSYQKLVYQDWGGVDLADLAAAVAYLRDQDWVDPDRIGVFGGSYGGFGVLSCLARRPDLGWAAGVDLFGPSNLVTFAESQPPTWRRKVRTVVGDPEADADFLTARSPVTYADAIRAPLFVVQGANDPRVPRAESDQIVERLRARGVEVRYDVYAHAGHGFNRREDQTRAYSDVAEFLVTHLGGRP